jgi:hypothetical protein
MIYLRTTIITIIVIAQIQLIHYLISSFDQKTTAAAPPASTKKASGCGSRKAAIVVPSHRPVACGEDRCRLPTPTSCTRPAVKPDLSAVSLFITRPTVAVAHFYRAELGCARTRPFRSLAPCPSAIVLPVPEPLVLLPPPPRLPC